MRISSFGTATALVALALLVAAACGGSSNAGIGTSSDAAADSAATGTTTEPASDGGAIDDAGDAGDAAANGCPATYAAATGACEQSATVTSGDLVCLYPQGTCRCAPARCGGVVIPIEDDAGSGLQWSCAAPRTDGCPEQNPNGQACTVADKSCSYKNGCCTDFATCTGGTWVTRPGACPL